MPGIAGRRALVKVAGVAVVFTDEATTTTDHQAYRITAATKGVWDLATQPVVKVGGSVTGESYTFNRLTGTVTFATVDAGRAAVTVSGKYLPLSVAIGSKSYSVALAAAALDDTDFDGANVAGAMTYQIGLRTLAGSIGRRLSIDTYFRDALLAGAPVVIEFYSDHAAAPAFTCWALLTKDAITAAVDAMGDASIDFTGTPDDQGVIVATA